MIFITGFSYEETQGMNTPEDVFTIQGRMGSEALRGFAHSLASKSILRFFRLERIFAASGSSV